MPKPRALTQREAAVLHGWRSGLEEMIASSLDTQGIKFLYEKLKIPFVQPVKPRHYTPDFLLIRNGIIVETKGRFLTADRAKHLLVRQQHPALDIRFLFSNAKQRISKQSLTTYAKWCESKGFLYSDKTIPKSWLEEAPNRASLAAIKALMES